MSRDSSLKRDNLFAVNSVARNTNKTVFMTFAQSKYLVTSRLFDLLKMF